MPRSLPLTMIFTAPPLLTFRRSPVLLLKVCTCPAANVIFSGLRSRVLYSNSTLSKASTITSTGFRAGEGETPGLEAGVGLALAATLGDGERAGASEGVGLGFGV